MNKAVVANDSHLKYDRYHYILLAEHLWYSSSKCIAKTQRPAYVERPKSFDVFLAIFGMGVVPSQCVIAD